MNIDATVTDAGPLPDHPNPDIYEVQVQVDGDVTLVAAVKVDAGGAYFDGASLVDDVPDKAERSMVVKLLKSTASDWYSANVSRTQGS